MMSLSAEAITTVPLFVQNQVVITGIQIKRADVIKGLAEAMWCLWKR